MMRDAPTRVPFDIGTIHFIGIGGIGMSGIAEIMRNLGYRVQGSDAVENANVKRLRALGIPVSMFTCIFSLARTVGWIAQWNEMISDPEQKIGRPRQLYKGAVRREVKPIDKR